eukprot:Opistho-2@26301
MAAQSAEQHKTNTKKIKTKNQKKKGQQTKAVNRASNAGETAAKNAHRRAVSHTTHSQEQQQIQLQTKRQKKRVSILHSFQERQRKQKQTDTRRSVDNVSDCRTLESVELGRRCRRVRSHVHKVQPVAHIERRQQRVRCDNVHRVARRPKQRRLQLLCRSDLECIKLLLKARCVVLERSRAARTRGSQDLGLGLLVVKDNVVEAAVHTVANVVLSNLLHLGKTRRHLCSGRLHVALATGNHVRCKRGALGGKKASGFCNHTHVRLEHRVEDGRDAFCNFGKVERFRVNAGPAASNVQKVEREAVLGSHVKDVLSHAECVDVGLRRLAAAAHVEAHADNLHLQLMRLAEKIARFHRRRAKLRAKWHGRVAVVRQDAENHLCGRMVLGDLDELGLVVKCHHLDSRRVRVLNVLDHLARIGKNNVLGLGAKAKCKLHLRLGRAVKARAAREQGAHDVHVGVALGSVEGVDAGKVRLPLDHLANDSAEVEDEKGRALALCELILQEICDLASTVHLQHLRRLGQIGKHARLVCSSIRRRIVTDDVLCVSADRDDGVRRHLLLLKLALLLPLLLLETLLGARTQRLAVATTLLLAEVVSQPLLLDGDNNVVDKNCLDLDSIASSIAGSLQTNAVGGRKLKLVSARVFVAAGERLVLVRGNNHIDGGHLRVGR